jgi:hypothetical protein
MNDRDQRRYDRATRVQTFGRDNTADFAAGSKATTLFTSLDDLMVKADDAKADQSPNRVSKETLLDGMLLDLKNISRTAREIEKTENGFAAPYRIPDNPAESAITTHADSVLGKLEDKPADSAAVKTAKAALRARFVAYELLADFVTHLRTDRDAITEANQRNQSEVQDGVGNTKLIDELLGQINDVIGGLDAIMFNKYTRVPEKLRAWQSASHVERAPQREKKTPTPPTPPPA